MNIVSYILNYEVISSLGRKEHKNAKLSVFSNILLIDGTGSETGSHIYTTPKFALKNYIYLVFMRYTENEIYIVIFSD